jgi:hypothetical protein
MTLIDNLPEKVATDEMQTILNVMLLGTALQKLESNHAKVRSLYRSQLFFESVECEHKKSNVRIADGSDCELVYVIGEELQEIKTILKKAIAQIEAKS